MREVYCFLAIDESESCPEMSKQSFASTMRNSIDRIIKAHEEEKALQALTAFGKIRSELWAEQHKAMQNLAAAEKSLEGVAKRVQDLQKELNAKDAETSLSRRDSMYISSLQDHKKRKLDEVEELLQDAVEVCKKVKQEEETLE